jgi:hypothetical protein
MRTIIVKLPPGGDLSCEMAEMRGWLDANGCTPSRFKYDLAGKAVIIQVVFNNDGEADVFKQRFDGRESDLTLIRMRDASPKLDKSVPFSGSPQGIG